MKLVIDIPDGVAVELDGKPVILPPAEPPKGERTSPIWEKFVTADAACNAMRKNMDEAFAALGGKPLEHIVEAAKRVVAERDELRRKLEAAENAIRVANDIFVKTVTR